MAEVSTMTREERIESLRQAATAAPAAASEPAVAPEATQTATPATDAQPQGAGEPAAAPAAPATPWWKLDKLSVLNEELDVDLEAMARDRPEEYRALVRKGLAHDKTKERLATRHETELAAERRKAQEAVTARDAEIREGLRASGLRYDPTTGKVVPLQPAAPPASAGQLDLDALEAKAAEENTPEAWLAYTKAIRALSSKPLDEATVTRIVEQRAQQQEAQSRGMAEMARKLDATFAARKADFDAAGPLAEKYRALALERATAHSRERAATPESTLQVIHATADLVKDSLAAAQRTLAVDLSRPRPKAPTVLPSGGAAPAAPVTDPSKIVTKTDRIAHLRRQAEARAARVAS